MDSTMDLDQLAIMLVVLVVMGTVICTVGAVLSCFSRSHNESRGIGTPNIPAWWRNVSGTADLDGYYTDEPDGFGLGLAGLRGQGAWDAAGTRSSFVSHDSDRVSRFIWEHQSPSSFRPMGTADSLSDTQVSDDMEWDDSMMCSPQMDASACYCVTHDGPPIRPPANCYDAVTPELPSPSRISSSEEPPSDDPRCHSKGASPQLNHETAPGQRTPSGQESMSECLDETGTENPDSNCSVSRHQCGQRNVARPNLNLPPQRPGHDRRDNNRVVASLPAFAAGLTVTSGSLWAGLGSWNGGLSTPTTFNPAFQDDEYLEPHPIQHRRAAVGSDVASNSGEAPLFPRPDRTGRYSSDTSDADMGVSKASDVTPPTPPSDSAAHGQSHAQQRQWPAEMRRPQGNVPIPGEPVTSPGMTSTLHHRWKAIRDELTETNR